MANNFLMQSLISKGLVQEDGTAPATTAGASTSPLPVTTEAGEGQPAGPTTTDATTTFETVNPEDNDEIAIIENPEDADDEATDAAIDAEVDDDAAEDAEIDQMMQRVDMLKSATAAVFQFGLSPSAVALGQATGLLDNTALYSMGCENFGADAETEKQLGLESLSSAGEAIAEKVGGKIFARAAGWSTKLVEIVSKSGKMVADAPVKVAEAAAGAAKAGTTFGRKAVSNVGEAAAKARGGAKTALLIAAAIAAVGGVITIAARQLPKETTEAATKTWFGKIRQAVAGVKWPFGKLELRPDSEATGLRGALGKLFCGGKPAKSAEATASGFIGKAAAWTKESVATVKGAIARAISAVIEAIKGAATAFTTALKNGASAASTTVGGAARGASAGGAAAAGAAGAGERGMHVAGILSHGTYFAGVAAVLAALAGLVYFVVIGGCRLVKKSFGN